jgi:hypothetical protein
MEDTGRFRVLGVKVLENCNINIRKILEPNRIYLFYKDYKPSDDNNWLVRKPEDERRVPEDFFDYPPGGKHPHISISAIVGKNGDGKSTIVELVIRIINNISAAAFKENQESLVNINGLHAELFYEIDGTVYAFVCNGEKTFWKDCANDEGTLVGEDFKLDNHFRLFYTNVTNYSIYAYNSNELEGESKGCSWIDALFHKNDGYQTPIVLNPMRTKGIIDINNENYLSRQRLMVLFMEDKEGNGIRNINEKCIAEGFQLKLKEGSAIHKDFEKYCQQNRDVEELKDPDSFLIDNSDRFLKNLLYLAEKYPEFFEIASKCNQTKQTDIDVFVSNLKNKKVIIKRLKEEAKDWVGRINYRQLNYLMLIAVIDYCWQRESSEGKFYFNHKEPISNENTIQNDLREKAYSYLIHKTLSIFENYGSIFNYSNGNFGAHPLFSIELSDVDPLFTDLDRSFDLLFDDILNQRSHVTLKLRQTLFFLMYNVENNIWENVITGNNKKKNVIPFGEYWEDMLNIAQDYNLELIELLPPPIFETTFIINRGGQQFFDRQLSSGERQRLYSTSSVLYHLRNLNKPAGTAEGHIQYRYINLVLEEIELYFHPAYQQSYIKYLLGQIGKLEIGNIEGINICLVTHSPFILSDIPKSNVLFLKDGKPHDEMQEDTFGANIQSLLQHGFLLDGVTMGAYARDVINELFRKLNDGKATPEMEKKIMLVGEPYIRFQLLKLFHSISTDTDNRIKKLECRLAELERRVYDKN